jgi:hypothetical protein
MVGVPVRSTKGGLEFQLAHMWQGVLLEREFAEMRHSSVLLLSLAT